MAGDPDLDDPGPETEVGNPPILPVDPDEPEGGGDEPPP